jgi:antitoxin YefM
VVDRLEREHGRVVITKHGRPAVVMLSLEDLESLEETLAVLSDPELVAAIAEADAEVAAGRATRLPNRRRWPRSSGDARQVAEGSPVEVVATRRMRAPITRPFTIWRGMISM